MLRHFRAPVLLALSFQHFPQTFFFFSSNPQMASWSPLRFRLIYFPSPVCLKWFGAKWRVTILRLLWGRQGLILGWRTPHWWTNVPSPSVSDCPCVLGLQCITTCFLMAKMISHQRETFVSLAFFDSLGNGSCSSEKPHGAFICLFDWTKKFFVVMCDSINCPN